MEKEGILAKDQAKLLKQSPQLWVARAGENPGGDQRAFESAYRMAPSLYGPGGRRRARERQAPQKTPGGAGEKRGWTDCGNLLFRLGLLPSYKGFHQTAYAVYLVREDPECLLLVTKCLYPCVARRYGTTWQAVERNIRFVAARAWMKNPQLLCELTGGGLTGQPTAAQFLAILARNVE